jgi:hypothetical protein
VPYRECSKPASVDAVNRLPLHAIDTNHFDITLELSKLTGEQRWQHPIKACGKGRGHGIRGNGVELDPKKAYRGCPVTAREPDAMGIQDPATNARPRLMTPNSKKTGRRIRWLKS